MSLLQQSMFDGLKIHMDTVTASNSPALAKRASLSGTPKRGTPLKKLSTPKGGSARKAFGDITNSASKASPGPGNNSTKKAKSVIKIIAQSAAPKSVLSPGKHLLQQALADHADAESTRITTTRVRRHTRFNKKTGAVKMTTETDAVHGTEFSLAKERTSTDYGTCDMSATMRGCTLPASPSDAQASDDQWEGASDDDEFSDEDDCLRLVSYAKEMADYDGVTEDLAYSFARDSFLADKVGESVCVCVCVRERASE